ncbi:FAD:protein FMN transferase [Allostella humosa]|uniref:FAD:protein FMN transferase n=1 Tax=Stella humosa TaxID=94 RepID=UPI000F4D2175|nr:FAD:protein FMN transferase [Stella humosa]BBK34433.1 FAD:protein FMN transferase [Stella humosa]
MALAGRTMGTTWQVRFVAPRDAGPGVVRAAIEAVFDRVIAEASGWEPDSALCRFNRAAAGTVEMLPAGLFGVLQHAVALARATGGACDPTVAPLVDLWGFGPPGPRHDRPTDAAIAAAHAHVGWERLLLDPERRAALQPGGLALDLSGIAKGWAVDLASVALTDIGIRSHLVEVGGELRGEGVKPDGQPWWVALEQPPGAAGPETLVALHGLSVATSGNYRRCFDRDGRRFAHTIDPRTGWPVADAVPAVTVLHASCMAADALATALTVMGPDAGMDHARRHDLAVLFVLPHGQRASPALAAMAG